MKLDHIRFGQDDVENSLADLRPEDIDQLAFGAIQVDREGRILYYSAKEGEISGRSPAEVTGKLFFEDVAPCTNRPEFRGRFDEGVASGSLNVVFDYTFDYRMAPTRVRVHMKDAMDRASYWIFVRKMDAAR